MTTYNPSDSPTSFSSGSPQLEKFSTNIAMSPSIGRNRSRSSGGRRSLTQPKPAPYRLSALWSVPTRLMRTSTSHSRETVDTISFGGHTAGKVRGTSRTKLSEVRLDDVINGHHLPPIALKDFEDYLCFVERSAENLYFEVWLNKYTDLYQSYEAKSADAKSIDDREALEAAYRQGITIFFNATSPLEVNIPSEQRQQLEEAFAKLRVDIRTSRAPQSSSSPVIDPPLPFLAPATFEFARQHTRRLLLESFRAFLLNQTRNAHVHRAWFARIVGFVSYLIGLLPTIICALLGEHRAYRAIGIPLWFVGIVTLIGGIKRTCLVIYLFGDARQLYPFELCRPCYVSPVGSDDALSPPAPTVVSLKRTPSQQSDMSKADVRLDMEDLKDVGAPIPRTLTFAADINRGDALKPDPTRVSPNDTTLISPFQFDDLSFFPTPQPAAQAEPALAARNLVGLERKSSIVQAIENERRESRRTGTLSSSPSQTTLYFAPNHILPHLRSSSPTFAPLTKVLSPFVIAAQRHTILTGIYYATFITIVTTAICMAVPNAS